VVEILNDDMPFLVDTVLQELTEFGGEIRLSPIRSSRSSAARRASSKPIAAIAPPARGGAVRESLIHIHIAGLIQEEAARHSHRDRLDKVLATFALAVQRLVGRCARLRTAIDDFPIEPAAAARR
jgi:glutamate dehydrogenase